MSEACQSTVDQIKFDAWKKDVDAKFLRDYGRTSASFPDQDYWEYFTDGCDYSDIISDMLDNGDIWPLD